MTRSLYAEFTALPGAEDRIEELLGVLTLAVRQEPGNLVFEAHRKHDEPSSFFVYEVYADDEAFNAHLDQEHGRVFNEALTDLVRGGASTLTLLSPIRAVE